jgi:2,4-dienoyl-CoA reductase-like NADH-dependent reductase (Old Yellow Enzyme family)
MSLFSHYRLGQLELPNRIVMAPMTRCRAIGGVPNALMREYYTQRASAGLIITEGTSPSPNGLGYARIPGLYSAQQIAGWRSVVEGVHGGGGRIFVQLMHVGRIDATAYDLSAPNVQNELGSVEGLQRFFVENNFSPESWNFNNRSIENNTGTLTGTVTLADGVVVDTEINMIKIEGDWLVSGIFFNER